MQHRIHQFLPCKPEIQILIIIFITLLSEIVPAAGNFNFIFDLHRDRHLHSSDYRFEVDERSGVVRTRGVDLFQLDMEYVLYVKAEDQNGKVDDRRFQSTPEERLSIVGGKRAPQFYMPSYEAEIPENQKKDSEYVHFFFK